MAAAAASFLPAAVAGKGDVDFEKSRGTLRTQAQLSSVRFKDPDTKNGAVKSEAPWFRSKFANSSKDQTEGALQKLLQNAKNFILDALVHTIVEPQNKPNLYFQGNFSPVKEIGSWVPVQVIDGKIPHDFPAGTYIRNGEFKFNLINFNVVQLTGPNPYLGGHNMQSPFGKFAVNWFEGDGMLHATRFDKGGKSISYQNKYVETVGLKVEKKTKKTSFLTAFEGDSSAIIMNYIHNLLRFGKVNRPTCNTHIFEIAGKIYAVAEADIPHEIDISDLGTISTLDLEGQWDRPFTAHPRVDLNTEEMIIFSLSAEEPYLEMGILSKEGKLVQKTDLKITRPIFMHEMPITKRYNLILDFPLTINVQRMLDGGRLVEFERDSYSRIGVMPRYGDATSIRWFDVQVGHSFHTVNAFEDGDEIVLLAIFAKSPFFPSPEDMDRIDWYARAITPTHPENADDAWIDGALSSHLHEWRFNLDKGTVVERDLTDLNTCGIEMPKINTRFVGRKNRYAYAQVLDVSSSGVAGMPKYGKMVKIQLPNSAQDGIKVEYHDLGENRYGSEPLFVARPNAEAEDDGWIVSYVHDEATDVSEVQIVDAKDFKANPIARIELPQRVPYGFHSEYFLTEATATG